jgi:hypothetical protein
MLFFEGERARGCGCSHRALRSVDEYAVKIQYSTLNDSDLYCRE